MSDVKCVVCNVNPPKYKCPQCELSTCSLPCVTIHKKELKCSGVRNKAGYIPLKKFDNIDLLNDYRFLEEVTRSVDNCRRNPHKRYTRYMQPLPTHLYRLKTASERRKTHLQYLPQHFSRHQENQTYLDYSSQIIHWKVDFIFPHGGSIKLSKLIDENEKISKVLDFYLNTITCPDMYKSALVFYHSAGLSDVELLLKAERVKTPNSFFLLDLHSTVKENLTHRVIIENPIIYVIKKEYKSEYNILEDSDTSSSGHFETVHGKKSGFFGDFSPVSYFDTLVKTEKQDSEGETAMKNIMRHAAALRGREAPDRTAVVSSDEEDNADKPSYSQKLNIPSYDSL